MKKVNLPKYSRDLRQGALNVVHGHVLPGERFRGRFVGRHARLIQRARQPPALVTILVDDQIRHDPCQPCPQVTAGAEPTQIGQGPFQSGLHHVFGIGRTDLTSGPLQQIRPVLSDLSHDRQMRRLSKKHQEIPPSVPGASRPFPLSMRGRRVLAEKSTAVIWIENSANGRRWSGSVTMLPRKSHLLLMALLLAGAGACVPQTVEVRLVLPEQLHLDEIRMFKVVNGESGPPKTFAVGDSVGIFSEDGDEIVIRAQGMIARSIVATGEVALPATELRLTPCPMPLTFKEDYEACEPPPDAGAGNSEGGSTEVADGGDGGETGDTGDTDTSGSSMCTVFDPSQPAAEIVSPAEVRPGCQQYCALMDQNCPDRYVTVERCHYACEKMNWPDTLPGLEPANSLRCRTVHAMRAGTETDARRSFSCYWASLNAGKACGNWCEVYCHMGVRACPGQFPEQERCTSACLDLEHQLSLIARDIHTQFLYCRFTLLQRAVFDPRLCSAAAPNTSCPSECRPPLNLPLQ